MGRFDISPEVAVESLQLTSPDVQDLEVVPQGMKDQPSVDARGMELATEIEGVVLERLRPLADDRGSMTEVVNFDHPFWYEPIVHSYCLTIRPGRIKGWGMHKLQADRYFLAGGQVRVALFDGRTKSPTYRRVSSYYFSEGSPGLLRIPPGVWHADQNWGDWDAAIVNFPTRKYDRLNPDKYRIDPHSGLIPFDWTLRDR